MRSIPPAWPIGPTRSVLLSYGPAPSVPGIPLGVRVAGTHPAPPAGPASVRARARRGHGRADAIARVGQLQGGLDHLGAGLLDGGR